MTTASENHFHAQRAKLQQSAEHWQNKLAYGDPSTSWEGDRALVLYHEPLTDEMVVYYELPNMKPQIVFKVPAEGFDIHKITAMLRDADGRRHSAQDQIAKVDAHNAKVEAEADYVKAQSLESAKEKMHWALRKDMGQSIAPLHVTRNPARVTG